MRDYLSSLVTGVSQWPGMTAHSHRFGGVEWRLGRVEVGHLHRDGTLDIPFTRAIHDHLLRHNLANPHHWVPRSGWITFPICAPQQVEDGRRLLRLSWLRIRLLRANQQPPDFELLSQLSELQFPPEIMQSLLGSLRVLPKAHPAI